MTELGADAYQLTFDANPRPMWLIDMATRRFLLVNDATCKLYGWTRDEFARMTLRDVRSPDQVAEFEASFAEKQHERDSFKRATRHRTKDGRSLDVVLEIARRELGGRLVSIVAITEVTGIDDVERRFQLMVEHSADGITLVDEANVLRYMSPGGERLLGVAPGELTGRPAIEIGHPDEIPIPRLPLGETRTYLVRAKHRNGSWLWLESTATNLTRDPAVRAIVSNFRDVSERIRAEDELRRSENNFRTLIERMPVLTLVHRDGLVRYLNPPAVAMLGYASADEVIGMPVMELVHPDDRAEVATRIQRTEREGGGARGEARIRRKDGRYVAVEGEGILLAFDGVPANVVVGRDVTERREMFARMAVADRMLSVGTLAAGVAHEINNPLSYVMSNLAVIASELAAETPKLSRRELVALVSDARDGAARVSAIVGELRALSRSDDDVRVPVDVTAVLASSIKMAHNQLRHRARLVESVPAGLPPVAASAPRLGQVFLNLLINAAQAIEGERAGGHEIRVRARDGGGVVIVEIEDTGVGISGAVIGRIFDPFFTTKPIGVGLGLGLAISHEIVRSFGGSIAVESQVGQGSMFRVVLPIAAEANRTVPSQVVAPKAATTARVLMIDDEAAVGRSIRMLLAPDYDITPVTRAREGLARLADGERFDAIVCDLMMPEMSGIELYEHLAPEYRRRVVFVTGGAFTQRAREFLAATAQPHVEKPFGEDELRCAIEQVRAT